MNEPSSENTTSELERWAAELELERLSPVPGTLLAEPLWQGGGNQRKPNVVTHGMSNTKFYRRWRAMVRRCTCPRDTSFYLYGGRGIRVCVRWLRFENFISDMGFPSDQSLQIERRDNNGHYTPSNCCWATRKAQGRNKRTNRLLSFRGLTKPMSQWAEELGVSYKALHMRLTRYGMSVQDALTFPPQRQPFERLG